MGENKDLSALLRTVKGRISRRINFLRRGCNRVWQAGFHDHAVRKEEDLESIGWYILENPVRAGLVDNYECYPMRFSSLDLKWSQAVAAGSRSHRESAALV
ncbi:MAG: hypothetical protein KJO54_00700, partial [Gammaproteobacteria bacterium]|nr:hypothetical protein [Gammaproteobacteria bacterium]